VCRTRSCAGRSEPLGLSARSAVRVFPFLALVVAFGLPVSGCGAEPGEPPDVAAPVPPSPIAGVYDVKGVTRPLRGAGEERRIAGTVILKQTGDAYSATFELDTTFPGVSDPVQADVIGKGEGSIEGRTLRGTTHTQLVVSTVPGIDTGFAFVPRIVGARIVSTSVTEIHPDGSVVIELENQPEEGEEDYRPTHTRLTGRRVGDSGAARIATPHEQPPEQPAGGG
jgi:hypothetical protein